MLRYCWGAFFSRLTQPSQQTKTERPATRTWIGLPIEPSGCFVTGHVRCRSAASCWDDGNNATPSISRGIRVAGSRPCGVRGVREKSSRLRPNERVDGFRLARYLCGSLFKRFTQPSQQTKTDRPATLTRIGVPIDPSGCRVTGHVRCCNAAY